MARRFTARLGAIAAVCAVVVVTLATTTQLFHSSTNQKPTTPQHLLDLAERPWQVRLFSGAVNTSGQPLLKGDRALEKLRDDGTGVDSRYQTDKDKSTTDARLQADGQHQAESESFYPIKPGVDEGRHPQAMTTYMGDDQIILRDERRHDGTRVQVIRAFPNGAKSIIDYADDGKTVIGEQLFDPLPKCCDDKPLLNYEKHWLADAEHTLVYSDVTGTDGKRTKTKFDRDHQVLWIMVCMQRQCYVDGTTVTGYYPGSDKLRFDSKSTYQVDEVKYYRKDGTPWFDEKIMPSSNDITLYDASGMKPVLEQNFFRQDETGSDKAIKMTANSVYEPFQIYEFDADGNVSNTFGFNKGKIDNVDVKNIILNGVFYKNISLYFDIDTGLFNWGVLFPGGPDTRIQVDKSNYTPPPLPRPSPDELKVSVPLFGDDLPVPPPQQYFP